MEEDTGIKFKNIDIEERKVLLDILGYEVGDGGIILNKNTKEQHKCPYTDEVVFIENASIMPGSTMVINTTELSLAEYLTQHIEPNF
jgi:hypothetical protein